MRPWVSLAIAGLREPRQDRWADVVPQTGGRLIRNYYDDGFIY